MIHRVEGALLPAMETVTGLPSTPCPGGPPMDELGRVWLEPNQTHLSDAQKRCVVQHSELSLARRLHAAAAVRRPVVVAVRRFLVTPETSGL